MDKKIKALIEKYSDNEALLIQLVVTAFARFNHLELGNGYLSAFVDAEMMNSKQTLNSLQLNVR